MRKGQVWPDEKNAEQAAPDPGRDTDVAGTTVPAETSGSPFSAPVLVTFGADLTEEGLPLIPVTAPAGLLEFAAGWGPSEVLAGGTRGRQAGPAEYVPRPRSGGAPPPGPGPLKIGFMSRAEAAPAWAPYLALPMFALGVATPHHEPRTTPPTGTALRRRPGETVEDA
jgi:hypothetical protein